MAELTYRTAGESHGQALIALVEGFPAGVNIDLDLINAELRRRQGGHGRGHRMRIEKDEARVLTGVRAGHSIGSPIAMEIPNADFRIDRAPEISRPRPGHADLAGSLKWLTTDCRETLERASARETAARVAAGALAKCLLRELGIRCVGFVRSIGPVVANIPDDADLDDLARLRDSNDVYCPDAAAVDPMIAAIDQAQKDKDTLGGILEVRADGLLPGLGSCASSQQKLDGRLMQAVGSIQAIKGVEIGLGFDCARRPGSQVHDAIYFDPAQRETPACGFVRKTNRAGGLEGGMTNGAPLILRAAMKPISTLLQGMDSVDLKTLQPQRSDYERSDICAVPAASVVVESAVAFELARALLDKFPADTLRELLAARDFSLRSIRTLPD